MAKTGWVSLLLFSILVSPFSCVSGQCVYQDFKFQSATLQSGTAKAVGAVYKFSTVLTGVDAYITILQAKNASVQTFDDDAAYYKYAWQPLIRNTSTTTTPSWVKFKIQFKRSSNSALDTLSCLAMGVIDCDGNSSFQERVSSSNQNSYKTISSTGVTFNTDSFFNVNGDNMDHSGIDTTAIDAMAQVNYANVSTIIVKIGAIGTCTNLDRQSCLYFKPFYSLTLSLPVILGDFNVSAAGQHVELDWQTLSEINNDHFEIERASDGEHFITIGEIDGNGNSDRPVNYHYTDNVSQGTYTYRLKQVDFNGAYSYSPLRSVHIGLTKLSNVSVMPNPATESCDIMFYSPVKTPLTVSLTDAAGQVIKTCDMIVNRGDNTHSLNVSDCTPGCYFIIMKTNTDTVINRIIKL